MITKRGGSREQQWCSVCRQAICSKCWDKWHSETVLVRGEIPDNLKKTLEDTEGVQSEEE